VFDPDDPLEKAARNNPVKAIIPIEVPWKELQAH
jgi:hypothetical protein